MDPETRNELAAKTHGLLRLGGLTLAVRTPDDSDAAFLAGEMRRAAKAKIKSPLAALAEEWASLPAAMRDTLAEKAVSLKAGGEVEPTKDQILAQVYDPAVLRSWVWWLARKDRPDLKIEDLAAVITETNVMEVLAELGRATGLEDAAPNSNGRGSSTPGSGGTGPASTGR